MFPLRLFPAIDRAWLAVRRLRSAGNTVVTAGAGIHGSHRVEVISVDEIFWPHFPTLAHSFWRAQEVTLFQRKCRLISGTVLDLGCGDGIFGCAAGFPEHCVGVDFDRPSLEARKMLLPKAKSIWGDASALPFENDSFDSVVSNSVMEHLPDLAACIAEVQRVLRPSGRFLFTMTLGEFTRQLERLTGKSDARSWCARFGHLQQPTRQALLQLLAESNFSIEEVFEYQPEWFTANYRGLLSPAAQFLEKRGSVENREKEIIRLSKHVKRSLAGSEINSGGCVWITASRR